MTKDMKPNLNDVIRIMMIKQHIKELDEELDEKNLDQISVFGAARFDYHLTDDEIAHLEGDVIGFAENLVDDGKRYLKFEMTDNIAKLLNGEAIFKATSIKPVSVSAAMLKTKPKSLK